MSTSLWNDFEEFYQLQVQHETLVNPVEYFAQQQTAGIASNKGVSSLQLLERHGLAAILRSFSYALEHKDHEKYTLAVKVVDKLLASVQFLKELPHDEPLAAHILVALHSGSPELTLLVLKLLTRIASGQIRGLSCFSRDSMFSDDMLQPVFQCLLSDNASVNDMAINALFALGGGKVTPKTLDSGNADEIDPKQRSGETASTRELEKVASCAQMFLAATSSPSHDVDKSLVKLRLYTLIARLCGLNGNVNALSIFRNAGLLESFFSTLVNDDDPLLQIGLIELVDNFSHSNEGIRSLIESSVYSQLLYWSGISSEEHGTFIGNSVHYLLSQNIATREQDWILHTGFLSDQVLVEEEEKDPTDTSTAVGDMDVDEILARLPTYYSSESAETLDFYEDEGTYITTFRQVSMYAIANIYCNAIQLRNFKSFHVLRMATIPGLFSMVARMNASISSTTISGEVLGGHALLSSLRSVFTSANSTFASLPLPSVYRVESVPLETVILGLNVLGRIVAVDGVLIDLCTRHLFRSVAAFSCMSHQGVKDFFNKSLNLRQVARGEASLELYESASDWKPVDVLRFIHSPVVGVSFFLSELCKLSATGSNEVRVMALSTFAHILSKVKDAADLFLMEKEYWRQQTTSNNSMDENSIISQNTVNADAATPSSRLSTSPPSDSLSSIRSVTVEDPVSPSYTNLVDSKQGRAFLESYYCLFNAIGCYSSSFFQAPTQTVGFREKCSDTTIVLGNIFTGVHSLPESRYVAYELLTALCAIPGAWGIRRVFGSSELEAVITDRSAASEQSAEGKRGRFAVIDATVKNPASQVLGEALLTKLRDLHGRGPYSIDMEDVIIEIGTRHG